MSEELLPDQSKSSHAHWLQVGVPAYISKMGTKTIAVMAERRVFTGWLSRKLSQKSGHVRILPF